MTHLSLFTTMSVTLLLDFLASLVQSMELHCESMTILVFIPMPWTAYKRACLFTTPDALENPNLLSRVWAATTSSLQKLVLSKTPMTDHCAPWQHNNKVKCMRSAWAIVWHKTSQSLTSIKLTKHMLWTLSKYIAPSWCLLFHDQLVLH